LVERERVKKRREELPQEVRGREGWVAFFLQEKRLVTVGEAPVVLGA
jgi:hypothetical protein